MQGRNEPNEGVGKQPSWQVVSKEEETVPPDDPEYDLAIERGEATFQQWAETWFYSQKRFNDRELNRQRYEKYREKMFKSFVAAEGPVLGSYYCRNVPAAAAITRKTVKQRRWLRRRQTELLTLHLLNNAPQGVENDPDGVAALDLLAECDKLATKADEYLIGQRRRQAVEMVYGLVTDLLWILDQVADRLRSTGGLAGLGVGKDPVPASESKLVEDARDRHGYNSSYLDSVAGRTAQFVFFEGMLLAAVGLGLFGWIIATISFGLPERRFVLVSFIAGAVGALTSVLTRVKSSGLKIDYEEGWLFLLILGGLRPVMGALAGSLLFFGVKAAIIPLALPTDSEGQFALFLVSAFFAGFNERWFDDMLAGVAHKVSGTS